MTGKNIKYYLLTSSALVLLALLTCFFTGFIQLFAGILISVILGAQTTKFHYGFVAASASLTFLIPLVFSLLAGGSFTEALLYAALFMIPIILMGFTLGFTFNLKISFYKTVIILAVLYLVGTLTTMKVLNSTGSLAMDIESIIAQSIDQVMLAFESTYSANPEVKELFSAVIGTLSSMMLTLSPSIFILLSLGVGYLTALVFKSYQKRRQADMSFWPEFYMQRADKATAILFVVIFFLNSVAPKGLFSDVSANIIVILSCIFFIYGLSFINWKMRASGMKASTRRLMLIALFFLCTTFFMIPFLVITVTGISDGIFDYRSRLTQNNDNCNKE